MAQLTSFGFRNGPKETLTAEQVARLPLEQIRALFAEAEDVRQCEGRLDAGVPRYGERIAGRVFLRSWGVDVRNSHAANFTWAQLLAGASLGVIRALLAVAVDERPG